MTRVLLVRHGQSEWNADGRWQGQADPPLTDLGRHQALHAARNLGVVDAIVASDLQRASETALIIAGELGVGPLVLEPDLRERDAGEWSGPDPSRDRPRLARLPRPTAGRPPRQARQRPRQRPVGHPEGGAAAPAELGARRGAARARGRGARPRARPGPRRRGHRRSPTAASSTRSRASSARRSRGSRTSPAGGWTSDRAASCSGSANGSCSSIPTSHSPGPDLTGPRGCHTLVGTVDGVETLWSADDWDEGDVRPGPTLVADPEPPESRRRRPSPACRWRSSAPPSAGSPCLPASSTVGSSCACRSG